MWEYSLTVAEAEFTREAICVLASAHWPNSLLSRLEQRGGICSRNMPLLFEVRVAYALHRLGIAATYEHPTGMGERSVDFQVPGPPEWLIEVVSLGGSDAIKAATKKSGDVFSLHLSSRAKDKKQSEEGELIKAMDRIAEKACKFTEPGSTKFHVILADLRGYLGGGGDDEDYREMAYGTGAARPEYTHWWAGKPILGLFDPGNSRESARLVRQRVHLIGFVKEQRFCEGEIQDTGFYLRNPGLIASQDDAERVFADYPLRPPNAGQS